MWRTLATVDVVSICLKQFRIGCAEERPEGDTENPLGFREVFLIERRNYRACYVRSLIR